MAVVSALLMLPTGVIFPALLRAGNTPPASETLKRVAVRQEEPEGPNHDLYDELQRKQEERVDNFRTALQDGERSPSIRASKCRHSLHRTRAWPCLGPEVLLMTRYTHRLFVLLAFARSACRT